MSTLLPPLAFQVGALCLVSQVVFSCLFTFVLPEGPWTQLPNVTAHQVVCFPLMVYLAFEGMYVWYTQQDELHSEGMEGRIFGISEGGVDIGAIVFGMMLFWDIPTSLVVPALQNKLMLAHHVGLLIVSGLSIGIFSGGNPLGSYYAPFFFGVIEFSTIFLSIVDLFHPKNAAWHQWLNSSQSTIGNLARTLNELCRPLFAISFLITRCVLFPYVMLSTCLLDFWKAAMLSPEERRGGSSSLLLFVWVLCLAFTFLQLHWGVLIAKQVAKASGLMAKEESSENLITEDTNLQSRND